MRIQFLGADNVPLAGVLVAVRDYWDACDIGHSLMETIAGAVDFQVTPLTEDSSNSNVHDIHISSAALKMR